MNPGGVRRVVFMRSFRVISQAGAKDTVATTCHALPKAGKLEPGEIDTLATRALVESYRAGQEIFAKGSPGRTMFAVLQGSVKIVSLSPTGKEVLTVIHAG